MKRVLINCNSQLLRNVFYFSILILSFHFIYLYWSQHHFYPFAEQVSALFDQASALLFKQSVWVLQSVLSIQITTEDQSIFTNAHQSYVEVSPGCTSLKQWMHWLFLMILFPGPWKHKAWYIPLGLVFIQFINVFRIVGLVLIVIPWPEHYQLFHTYFFRPLFYFLIFLMWAVWLEFFVLSKVKSVNPNT